LTKIWSVTFPKTDTTELVSAITRKSSMPPFGTERQRTARVTWPTWPLGHLAKGKPFLAGFLNSLSTKSLRNGKSNLANLAPNGNERHTACQSARQRTGGLAQNGNERHE
jgi:hypothetical protein